MEYCNILLVISTHLIVCDSFFLGSLTSNRTTTTKKPYITNSKILDPLAATYCPKHLPRTRTLMYNTFTKHCFQINVDKKADWLTAKLDCESLGGYLAVIEGISDNTFVGFRSHAALGYHEDEHLWIGLSDNDTEGVYKWTNGAYVQSPVWADGEPNGGTKQNCVAYNRESDKFEDWECSHSYAWICQYDLNARPPLTALPQSTPSTTSTQKITPSKTTTTPTSTTKNTPTVVPTTLPPTTTTVTTTQTTIPTTTVPSTTVPTTQPPIPTTTEKTTTTTEDVGVIIIG
uniref:Putative C-type lectin 1 n=1 Tax=Pinctada fucata TaxID=50426 RepID=A0A194AL95_PINFU